MGLKAYLEILSGMWAKGILGEKGAREGDIELKSMVPEHSHSLLKTGPGCRVNSRQTLML